MFTNFIKIALLRLNHYRAYTLINVLGPAMGLCSCLVIWLIKPYEFSFDKFHADGNRIYAPYHILFDAKATIENDDRSACKFCFVACMESRPGQPG
ncbi:MAG TPA: hypothetical protein VK645_15815 [Chitinophagaceae bacterium]|nr:hypothetical protein [Chitinophagaceae bacterium]